MASKKINTHYYAISNLCHLMLRVMVYVVTNGHYVQSPAL